MEHIITHTHIWDTLIQVHLGLWPVARGQTLVWESTFHKASCLLTDALNYTHTHTSVVALCSPSFHGTSRKGKKITLEPDYLCCGVRFVFMLLPDCLRRNIMSAAQMCDIFINEKTCLRQIKAPWLLLIRPHGDQSPPRSLPTASIEHEGFLWCQCICDSVSRITL